MRVYLPVCAAIILVFSFTGLLHADIISITGNSTITIGVPTFTYGQTFRVPASSTNENVLKQFSFTFSRLRPVHCFDLRVERRP
jgi:hypothetical protein